VAAVITGHRLFPALPTSFNRFGRLVVNEATESNGLVPIGSSGNTTAENFNFGKISCGLHFFRILPLIGSFRQLFFRAKEPQSLEPSRLGSVVTNLSLASRAG